MAPRPEAPASLRSFRDHAEAAERLENDLLLHHVLVLFRHGDRSPISRNMSAKAKMTQVETEYWASCVADLSVVHALNSGTRVTAYHESKCTDESCYDEHFKVPAPPDQGGRWPRGQLTAKGVDMMRMKGKKLKDRYPTMLQKMKDPTRQVYVESTNVRRSIRSAQSLLAGLFPDYFTKIEAQHKGSIRDKVQHVQVAETMRKKEVFVIHADASNTLVPQHSNEVYSDTCKLLVKELQAQAPPGFVETSRRISTILGARSSELVGWTRLREVLICHEAHGLAFPAGLDTQLLQQLCHYDAWLWHHLYGQVAFCRSSFKSGVQRISSYLNGIIKGAFDHQLALFSTHDNSLVAFVNALQLQTPRVIPPYGAMLTFELYRHRVTGNFYLKTLYEGVDVAFTNHKHSALCPFAVFEQAAQTFLQVPT